MRPEQTRQRFVKIVKKEGVTTVAGRLGCSTMQVRYLVSGQRDPGMRTARAIEEIYEIPMRDWVEPPVTTTVTVVKRSP